MKKVLEFISVVCGFTLMYMCFGFYCLLSGEKFEVDTTYTGF